MITAKIIGQDGEDWYLQITIGKREFVFTVWENEITGVVSWEMKFPTEYISFNKLIQSYIPWIGNLNIVKKNIGINIQEHDDSELILPDFWSWDDFNKFIKFLNNFSEI